MNVLDRIQAPTLSIVGGNDFPVIDLKPPCFCCTAIEEDMVIVPGANSIYLKNPDSWNRSPRGHSWFQEN